MAALIVLFFFFIVSVGVLTWAMEAIYYGLAVFAILMAARFILSQAAYWFGRLRQWLLQKYQNYQEAQYEDEYTQEGFCDDEDRPGEEIVFPPGFEL